MGTGPALVERFTGSSDPADRPGAALPAGRALADGLAERHLRRHPRGHLPRAPACPVTAGTMTHRHPDRLHHAAERPVPADHGPAQHQRLGDQLAGPVRADLRVPRPAGRGRRPGPPGRDRPGRGHRARPLRRRRLHLRRAPTRRRWPASTSTSPAGTTLALVGETGSGKTTLGSLVARLYDPTQRHASRIDGIDIRDMRLADLAEIVGRGQPGDLPAAHHGAREPALRQARRHRRRDRGRPPAPPRSTT